MAARGKVDYLPYLLLALASGMQCSSSLTKGQEHIWHWDSVKSRSCTEGSYSKYRKGIFPPPTPQRDVFD